MKISEQDIIRMTQELRDEENQQPHVRPWSRHHRFQFPAWLAAIPAATIAGFFLGIWTNSHTQDEHPLAALVDTVYIQMKESPASADTTPPPVPSTASLTPSAVHRAANNMRHAAKKAVVAPTGQSMMNDQIRYDLLVKN